MQCKAYRTTNVYVKQGGVNKLEIASEYYGTALETYSLAARVTRAYRGQEGPNGGLGPADGRWARGRTSFAGYGSVTVKQKRNPGLALEAEGTGGQP